MVLYFSTKHDFSFKVVDVNISLKFVSANSHDKTFASCNSHAVSEKFPRTQCVCNVVGFL